MSIIVCSFTAGLDDLPKKKQADHVEVLRALHAAGRFSAFEASANETIARTMTYLCHSDLMTTDKSCGYPWTKVKLTAKGLALIGQEARKEGGNG